MNEGECMDRFIACTGRHDLGTISKNNPRASDGFFGRVTATANDMAGLNLTVEDQVFDISGLEAVCRRARLRDKLGLVVVDYLGLVQGGQGDSKEQHINDVAVRCKRIASVLQVPVLTLTQLNDSGLVRDSRAPEHHCDIHLSINEDHDEKGAFWITVRKNRNGPRDVRCKCAFVGRHVRFEELAKEVEP
jgi:replicative DNA helicase